MHKIYLDNRLSFSEISLLSWRDVLREPLADKIASCASACPCALIVDNAREAVVATAVAFHRQLDVVLVGRDRMSDGVRRLLESQNFMVVDLASPFPVARGDLRPVTGRISLLTSGSTGTPKLVSHTWQTLFTATRGSGVIPRRWIVPFQLGTYAWFQIVTQGMFQPEQALLFPAGGTPAETMGEAARWRADSLSATPTFWRIAMLQTPREILADVPLKYISIGGEMVDQSLLDQLGVLFPQAQITHIYASSEVGTCVIVKDGLAGFPASVLERTDASLPQLRVEDGRLLVKSPYSAVSAKVPKSEWVDTGDVVEIRGKRIYFCGRADRAMINVGGNKAYPADIEAAILAHPGIQWCRVRAVKARIVGELVEADFVLRADASVPGEADLVKHCSQHLPEYAIPRLWNRLEAIPVKSSLKSELA